MADSGAMNRPARGVRGRGNQSGVALILVLWTLLLLTTIAASLTFVQRTEIDLSRGLMSQVTGRQLAQAGLNYAVYMLQLQDSDRAWETDGVPRLFQFGEHAIEVTVFQEQGLIDLNKAGPQLLAEAFAQAGLDEKQVPILLDRVMDWMDEDDAHRLYGAEWPEYQAAGYLYGPTNGPFRDLAELRLVHGVTHELYQRLLGVLTVDSGRADVNLNAAPVPVLALLEARNTPGLTPDVRVAPLRPLPIRGVAGFVGGIADKSLSGFRIQVSVLRPDTAPYVTEATVVLDNRAPRGYRIVKWHWGGMPPGQEDSGDRSGDGQQRD